MSTVAKVSALLALSASVDADGKPTPEARNAAFAACAIIRDKGLHVGEEAAPGAPEQETDEQAVWIWSKFQSLCVDCRSRIEVGDRAIWVRGRGCWHPECYPR